VCVTRLFTPVLVVLLWRNNSIESVLAVLHNGGISSVLLKKEKVCVCVLRVCVHEVWYKVNLSWQRIRDKSIAEQIEFNIGSYLIVSDPSTEYSECAVYSNSGRCGLAVVSLGFCEAQYWPLCFLV
jgi:hypothetical protein